jgi:hypothetical protein
VIGRPDPTGAEKPWIITPISTPGWAMSSHGVGIGDVDGDKRPDLLVSNGWWQQPTTAFGDPWSFHPVTFGNVTGEGAGAQGATAQM